MHSARSRKRGTADREGVGRATVSRTRPRKKLGAVLGAVAFALVVGSVTLVPASQASFPGLNGKIAFFSNRDGDFYEIYVMNADGINPIRLTNSPGVDEVPEWSPDGTKIAFDSERNGNFEVYVMNADGTGQTRLTNNSASDIFAAWSPDGTEIAFCSDRDGGLCEIYKMNADGTWNDSVDFAPIVNIKIN